MVDMPAAVDDDMPVDPGEQRRGRRKMRHGTLPEVVLGANGIEFGNCGYFVFGILEPRSCPSIPHIEPFQFRSPPPSTAVVPRLLQASQQEVRDVTAAVWGPCQGARARGLWEPRSRGALAVRGVG